MCARTALDTPGATKTGAPEPVLSEVEWIREANLGIRAKHESLPLKAPLRCPSKLLHKALSS